MEKQEVFSRGSGIFKLYGRRDISKCNNRRVLLLRRCAETKTIYFTKIVAAPVLACFMTLPDKPSSRNQEYDRTSVERIVKIFGNFKNLGAYPQINSEYITDGGNTYHYAVNKLIQWGYTVSAGDDSVEFSEYCNIHIAEKIFSNRSTTIVGVCCNDTRVWGRLGLE